MKFKQIDINCFKSFPEFTSFPIDNGLTGIVGPNGCGKSNVVEALKWVMGETSAKSLRGTGMEDVIFNGTSDRPSKNFCEVTLKLENDSKNKLLKDPEEIEVKRKLEKDKGSKYFLNGREVRAKDIHILFADLSTGPHSPSMVSQGRIGNLITAKPTDRRAILEEAAGIGGLHARRHEAELRLSAAENNLNKADDIMKQTENQLKNLQKQAAEASKYKLISEDIKRKDAGLIYLSFLKIEKEIQQNKDALNEIEDEISAINIDKNYNLENLKKLENEIKPTRDKSEEQNTKLQKILLDADKINEEEKRVKETIDNIKVENKNVASDITRENEIILKSGNNEDRLKSEREELLDIEKNYYEIEKQSTDDYKKALNKLSQLQVKIKDFFETVILYLKNKDDVNTDNIRNEFNTHLSEIADQQEIYATRFGKYDLVKQESIKRKERLLNIEKEVKNWRDLKENSNIKLIDLKNKMKLNEEKLELEEIKPKEIAEKKGSYSQNIKNIKEILDQYKIEITNKETAIVNINENLNKINNSILEKTEKRVRSQTIIEGLKNRIRETEQKCLIDFKIEIQHIPEFSKIDGLSDKDYDELQNEIIDLRKKRDQMGAVNLRADNETKDLKDKIDKMMKDRTDLVHGIQKLKGSINDLNQKGRERLLEAFEKVGRKFNDVYTKLFAGGSARLEMVESDDPLEAGLELLVSPPGKKLQSITLLSGGEQALTALALIFAVFLINPAPICVLDEVDAPLDDANVTRFCGLLDELTTLTDTKFIIITHHALTMSRMNRLFGVTMSERGVSQLVSVNLDKAEELVA